jgi:hypothetical protein
MDTSDGTGDYLDEATLANKDLNTDLRAVIYINGSGTYPVNVNVLTEMTVRLLGLMGGDKGSSNIVLDSIAANDISKANEKVTNLLGLGAIDLATSPANVIIDTQAQRNPNANEYGYALASISGMEKTKAVSTSVVIDELTQMITNGALTPAAKYDVISGAGATGLDMSAFAKQVGGESIAPIAKAIQTIAAGGVANMTLTPADFAAIGVAGVTKDNLSELLSDIATKNNTPSEVQTVGGITNIVVEFIDKALTNAVTAAKKATSAAETAKAALADAIAKLGSSATAAQIAEVEAKKALAQTAIKEAETKLAAAKAAENAASATNKIDPSHIESANTAISKGATTVTDVTTVVKASADATNKVVNALSEAATTAANEASSAASAVNSAKTELEAAVSHIGHPATDAQIVDVTLKEQA